MTSPLSRLVRALSSTFGVLSGAVIGIMMVHVVLDVLSRNILNSPLPGTLDFITYWWMPISVFFALGAVQYNRAHIEVSLLTDGAGPRARVASRTVTALVMFIVALLMVYHSVSDAVSSYQIGEAALGAAVVPIWLPKILAALGLLVFLLQIIEGYIVDAMPHGQHLRAN